LLFTQHSDTERGRTVTAVIHPQIIGINAYGYVKLMHLGAWGLLLRDGPEIGAGFSQTLSERTNARLDFGRRSL
jgi:hypothetical protein